jgi:hypothetical protein
VAAGVGLKEIEDHLNKRTFKVTRRAGNAKEWRTVTAEAVSGYHTPCELFSPFSMFHVFFLLKCIGPETTICCYCCCIILIRVISIVKWNIKKRPETQWTEQQCSCG